MDIETLHPIDFTDWQMKDKNFEIIDVEERNNINAPLHESRDVEYLDYEDEERKSRSRTKTRRRSESGKKEKSGAAKYGWAFFLASMFIGLGMTATFDHPFFLFGGMGLGFLFFVDPFYNKVMEIFKRL